MKITIQLKSGKMLRYDTKGYSLFNTETNAPLLRLALLDNATAMIPIASIDYWECEPTESVDK